MNHKLKNKILTSKGLLFDMDGVVTDSMPRHVKAWCTAFRIVSGIEVPPLEIYRREGEKSEKSVREILSGYSIAADNVTIDKILNMKAKLFTQTRGLRFFRGIKKILKKFSMTKQLALVTGTQKKEVNALLDRRIKSFFRAIITSDDIICGKPHPEPYLKALSMIKLEPEDCLVIENAPYGIQSAHKAGIEVLAIATTLDKSELNSADYICCNHNELYKHINTVRRKDITKIKNKRYNLQVKELK